MVPRKAGTTAQQPATRGAPLFFGLPVEMIELIARAVPAEDLPAMRLVCRELEHAIHRVFVQTHFTDKTFMLPSPESMQALVEISKHSIYGKLLKKVRLVNIAAMETRFLSWRITGGGAPVRTREERVRSRAMRIREEQTYEKQIKYYKQCQWSADLIEALQNFKETAGSLTIAFEDDNTRRNSACGMRKLLRFLECSRSGLITMDADEDMVVELLQAIVQGSCPIVGFELTGFPGGIDLPLWTMGQSSAIDMDPTVFAGLREIDMFLSSYAKFKNVIEYVLAYFGGLQSVQRLRLRTTCGLELADLDSFLRIAWLPNIQHLTLSGACVYAGVLDLEEAREVMGAFPDVVFSAPAPPHALAKGSPGNVQ
ncbi:hypothetical protein LTR17_005832 [Elasticomyces elasticus]|nr:hypothetical protein LTR17_005832 [Elasticomyces elasticus]